MTYGHSKKSDLWDLYIDSSQKEDNGLDLWTKFRGTREARETIARRDGITTRGDAAKYYPNKRHKGWCVFTHEYME